MNTCKFRKIAVMGYRSVGKSSLSLQFVDGQFMSSYEPTIENTFMKKIKTNSHDYELTLVDTSGQDELTLFPSQYSIDVHGYVLVYSITDLRSFEVISAILKRLKDLNGEISVPVILVGNKNDLNLERVVTYDTGKQMADYWHIKFMETSAKRTESASEVFYKLLTEMEKLDGTYHDKSGCRIS